MFDFSEGEASITPAVSPIQHDDYFTFRTGQPRVCRNQFYDAVQAAFYCQLTTKKGECNLSKCFGEEAQGASITFPGFSSSQLDNYDEVVPIPMRHVNFHSLGLIPTGWKTCDKLAPSGFMIAGGGACLIEDQSGRVKIRHVLLALPEWAVDMKQAKYKWPNDRGSCTETMPGLAEVLNCS